MKTIDLSTKGLKKIPESTFIQCVSALTPDSLIELSVRSAGAGKYVCSISTDRVELEFDEVFTFTGQCFAWIDVDYLSRASTIEEILSEILSQSTELTFDGSDTFGSMNIELKSKIISPSTLNASIGFSEARMFATPSSEEVREHHGVA